MPRITVRPVHADGEPRRWTLSERIVPENLDSEHYLAQLLERLTWATADAEAAEAITRSPTRADRLRTPRPARGPARVSTGRRARADGR